MPVPTTHTDVLIPAPQSDDTVSAAKVTLRGSLSSATRPFDATEIIDNAAGIVRSNQTIRGTMPEGDFEVDMEIVARDSNGRELSLALDPAPTSANAPHTPQTYIWNNVGGIEHVAIKVGGTLRGTALLTEFILGSETQKQARLTLKHADGVVVAFVDVDFA